MKGNIRRILSLIFAITLFISMFISNSVFTAAAVDPTIDITPGNKIGLEKEGNTWVYYGSDKKINTKYVGMAKNQYGWWYVTGGKLNTTYVGLAKNQYGWWYLVNGKINKSYNSLARNDYGWWYIKNGTIDFKFSGTFKNNMGTWNVKSGKATLTSKVFPSITNYEVDAKSVTTKTGAVVRAWRIQQNGLYIEIHRVKYGDKITQRFIHSQDSQVKIEKTLTYQPYATLAITTVDNPTRLGVVSSKSLMGTNSSYVEDMAKKNGAVIAINGEAQVYKTDHSTVRNGKVEVSSTASTKVKYLHIYRDGSWQFKAMDNANINKEVKNGLYNTLVTMQNLAVNNGKEYASDRDTLANGQHYYSNRTMLGRISNNKTVFAIGEFMPIINLERVLIAYGVSNAIILNGGNCSSMYVKGVGNTTGAIGKSLKNLNKVTVLETEYFGNNHMIGNNSQGYEMLGGPCKEPDMIYIK